MDMSGCGSCSACGGGDRAQEYKNCFGQSAVRCPLCDREVTFDKLPASRRVKCDHCDTVIEVIPLLLN
jgi:ribosomal protein S27E